MPNQNLFKIANEKTGFEESFTLSNAVLKNGVQSVTDLMVRPGMINLDFADVETIMSSMGKAMMGTGEAEGDDRAAKATEMALNNPLIDEYSLKGARGLLVNITGSKDITLFEVDQAVNKIRAEVDPEAELIFGAIKDENMSGKIRVSIVATALDGQRNFRSTVFNVVSRIQNRNNGQGENLFTHKNGSENNALNSIDGATALKLEDEYIPEKNNENLNLSDSQNYQAGGLEGVSVENMSYIENNIEAQKIDVSKENSIMENSEEITPPLFSNNVESENLDNNEVDFDNNDQKLFEDDTSDDDFEIPAFLRKQKF